METLLKYLICLVFMAIKTVTHPIRLVIYWSLALRLLVKLHDTVAFQNVVTQNTYAVKKGPCRRQHGC
jgi:hypothetical protein